MDISERFEWYMEHLVEGLAHSDRRSGLRGYCTGLMLPLSRKSVEPMAAQIDPQPVSARHQALHHFVAKSQWSDESVLARVREQVAPLLGTEGGRTGSSTTRGLRSKASTRWAWRASTVGSWASRTTAKWR